MSGYPTLDAARKNTRIEWYRTKIDRSVLTAMTRRSDMKGMIQALGHLLIYSISAASAIYLWSRQLWIGLVLTLWIHGMVTSFFHGTATHELSHKTVFRTKRFNEVFLYLFSLLGWWNPVDYQASHRHHHLYTLYPAVDRENVLPLPPVPGIFTIFQLFTVNLFTLPRPKFRIGRIPGDCRTPSRRCVWTSISFKVTRFGMADSPPQGRSLRIPEVGMVVQIIAHVSWDYHTHRYPEWNLGGSTGLYFCSVHRQCGELFVGDHPALRNDGKRARLSEGCPFDETRPHP